MNEGMRSGLAVLHGVAWLWQSAADDRNGTLVMNLMGYDSCVNSML